MISICSIHAGKKPGNLDEERRALPIFQARGKFVRQMQGLHTAIVIGETGSGKTTQIPQVHNVLINKSVVR